MRHLLSVTVLSLLLPSVLLAGTPEVLAKEKELVTKLEELEKNGKKKAKKLKGGVATLKGQAICEALHFFNSQGKAMPKAKAKELKALNSKWCKEAQTQFEAGGRFTVECGRVNWKPVTKSGEVTVVDYVGGKAEEFDEKVFAKFMSCDRIVSYAHVKAGKASRSPTVKKADAKGIFSSYQDKDAGTGVFFYLRAKKATNAKVKVSDLKKGAKFTTLIVNGEPTKGKAKKDMKIELLEGVNGIVLLFENKKGGDMKFSIKVDGKDLEVGAVGK